MEPEKPRIPFNKAGLRGGEARMILDAVRRGHISGDGSYTRRCHAMLERLTGAKKALLTTSCTHALEMAALLLDLRPGDEVIVPSFTFVSTANAFALHGATLRFIDSRPDTLNMDERALDALITKRTRAVVPVHYAGVACEMDAILQTARRRGIAVIEDNAHGLFGKYKGRPLGGIGSLAALSFHETKNVTCGEGGALLINDAAHIQRAEIIREKGTNRSRFFRGEVDKYTWVDIGSSYLPSDVLAAFLCAQLNAWEKIQSKRRRVWEFYDAHLQDWARRAGVRLPVVPGGVEQAYHMYYLLFPNLQARQHVLAGLKARGILGTFHYLPLHISEMGRRFGGRPGDCPVSENLSDRILRLPFYADITPAEQAEVIDALDASWKSAVRPANGAARRQDRASTGARRPLFGKVPRGRRPMAGKP